MLNYSYEGVDHLAKFAFKKRCNYDSLFSEKGRVGPTAVLQASLVECAAYSRAVTEPRSARGMSSLDRFGAAKKSRFLWLSIKLLQ